MVKYLNWIYGIIILASILIMFLLFLRMPLTGEVPQEMIDKADELKKISKTKMELARNTYDFVDKKFNSPVRQYLKEPNKVFMKNRGKIFALEDEYIPSNTQNQLFKELLILTGEFNEDDFTFVQARCYLLPRYTPHEYWILDIDGKEVFIDLWFEDHTTLETAFGCYASPPCGKENAICSL